MLFSDSKRFVFIHVQKTAGTSVGAALRPYANAEKRSKLGSFLRLFDFPRDYRRYKFRTHASLRDVQRKLPAEVFNGYFKFAFVRNPWDRLVSEYNAALKKHRNRRHRRIARLGDFEAFIRHELKRGRLLQYPMLANRDGEIGVDFVGRFESLDADFDTICRRIGVPNELSHLNAHPHRNYREYYDEGTRRLVAEGWAQDVETFGYEF